MHVSWIIYLIRRIHVRPKYVSIMLQFCVFPERKSVISNVWPLDLTGPAAMSGSRFKECGQSPASVKQTRCDCFEYIANHQMAHVNTVSVDSHSCHARQNFSAALALNSSPISDGPLA